MDEKLKELAEVGTCKEIPHSKPATFTCNLKVGVEGGFLHSACGGAISISEKNSKVIFVVNNSSFTASAQKKITKSNFGEGSAPEPGSSKSSSSTSSDAGGPTDPGEH